VESDDLRMTADAARPARDRPARVHDSLGAHRHGVESHLDPHEASEAAFLASVLDRAAALVRASSHASLVLCAPPRALGLLRGNLPPDVRERLVLSVDKDVTKETPRQLDARFKNLHV
jgi:protein required for attachment to host cells